MNLPKCGAHGAFQNPKDIERLGQGLPSKAQSSTCTPVPGGSLGVHGILSFSPEHLGDFLREPVQMPTPGPPPPPAPGEGLGEAGKSASPLSTRASRNPVAWLLLGFHFSFSFFFIFTWIKAQSCVNHTLSTSLFILGLGWAILLTGPSLQSPFPTLVPLSLPPGTHPVVDTDPYIT